MSQASEFFAVAQQFSTGRVTRLRASFLRVIGIAQSMRAMIARCGDDVEHRAACAALRVIEKKFHVAQLAMADMGSNMDSNWDANDLRTAVIDFPLLGQQLRQCETEKAWLQDGHKQNAAALLARHLRPTTKAPLRILGQGSEGTVFVHCGKVYKVLYGWFSYDGIAMPELLKNLQPLINTDSDVLYPIIDHWRDGGDLVLVMPYEKTQPYHGRYGVGIIEMLIALRRLGLVARNIKPKNLRRNKNRVRLIDYGHQIHPFTEEGFSLMVHKAWLSWRYASRSELPAWLTASLRADAPNTMPQLAGYQNMKYATEQYATDFRIADTAVAEILAASPKRVLDYGCGKGRDAAALAKAGRTIAAYDPYLPAKAKQILKAANVRLMNKTQLAVAKPYDAILIRHVICEIRADRDLTECLSNIRRLIAQHGKVVVTACDMDRIVKEKLHAVNLMPRHADGDAKFFYRKELRKNGSVRPHVHRPQPVLEKMFMDAGLEIASCQKFLDMDLENFQPCGGVLQWILIPATTSNRVTSDA